MSKSLNLPTYSVFYTYGSYGMNHEMWIMFCIYQNLCLKKWTFLLNFSVIFNKHSRQRTPLDVPELTIFVFVLIKPFSSTGSKWVIRLRSMNRCKVKTTRDNLFPIMGWNVSLRGVFEIRMFKKVMIETIVVVIFDIRAPDFLRLKYWWFWARYKILFHSQIVAYC